MIQENTIESMVELRVCLSKQIIKIDTVFKHLAPVFLFIVGSR